MKSLLYPWLIFLVALSCRAAETAATATAQPAPPPSAPALRSADELQKLVAPIALYPDSLIATLLPASVYPLEVVQAARFVANTNQLDQLDQQPWDASVKAVARVPDLIRKMNEDIAWTIELGEAFLAQDKDVMDAIQTLRAKSQKAGILQNTSQQVVVVTNVVVERTVEQQVVVVTNTVVQIQSAKPDVVYVPQYDPTYIYAPPPYYVYDPVAPLVTFGFGLAMGAIIADNHCDWFHGGCYHGDIDVDIDRNVNRNVNRNRNANRVSTTSRTGATGKKWQPDQSRLRTSGSTSASGRSAEARGWSSAAARPSTQPGARPTPSTGARPTASTGARATSAGGPSARQGTGSAAARPSVNASSPGVRDRATPSTSSGRAGASGLGNQGNSAFGGVGSGSASRSFSNRGVSSRGGGGGGFRGGGGGFRGGGRR
jgi:hypothetical protein